MSGRHTVIVLWVVLLTSFVTAVSAQERWVYRYSGIADAGGGAYAVAVGVDSNIYAAGWSAGSATDWDFTVISLTPSGERRWLYRYDGPGHYHDCARAIVIGGDDNVYVAGLSSGGESGNDFTVIALTPLGRERWVYRYSGPEYSWDEASSIEIGADGNLYVAGTSMISGVRDAFTAVSITPSGKERWVYRYCGDGGGGSARSIVTSVDSAVYVAGRGALLPSNALTVVGLRPSGAEFCVYRSLHWGEANSIVIGPDGDTYAAGWSYGGGYAGDFTVVGLTTWGRERWVYEYEGPGRYVDVGNSIVMGMDGDLYAAGYSRGSGTREDLTVVGLTHAGGGRWVYRYNGPGNDRDEAHSVVAGTDGNVYVAGYSGGSGSWRDFTVVGLTRYGQERWVYRYNGPENDDDVAYSIAVGPDGNLYSAGWSRGRGGDGAFIVISLSPEALRRVPPAPGIEQVIVSPIPALGGTSISFLLMQEGWVNLSVYDSGGRLIRNLLDGWEKPNPKVVQWNLEDSEGNRVRSGAYFVRLQALDTRVCKKVLVLR